MRLLIVSQYFWPETFRINDLAAELIARGHEVTVLTSVPNYPEGKVFPDFRNDPQAFSTFRGAPVVRVPMLARGRGNLRLALNYLSFIAGGLLWGPPRLRGRQFDAIFVFLSSPVTSAIPALLLRRIKRAPTLIWVLDLWPETLEAIGVLKSRRMLGLVGKLVRSIYRRCDLILVQSRAFFGNVERYSDDPRKIRYFPGWPETIFSDAGEIPSAAPELAPFAQDFTLLFAGNIGQAQDFPAIVAAADLLRDVTGLRFVIIGDGRAAEQAKADVTARALDDKVVFLGRFPLARMPSFFAGADALLVTLRDEPIWAMTIPGKVQSYLASGVPILGMLNGEGARVIEEAGAGFAAPAGDAAALAASIRRLMAMTPEERRSLGEAGRAYCEREFDRSMLIDRLEAWIGELEQGNNRGN